MLSGSKRYYSPKTPKPQDPTKGRYKLGMKTQQKKVTNAEEKSKYTASIIAVYRCLQAKTHFYKQVFFFPVTQNIALAHKTFCTSPLT